MVVPCRRAFPARWGIRCAREVSRRAGAVAAAEFALEKPRAEATRALDQANWDFRRVELDGEADPHGRRIDELGWARADAFLAYEEAHAFFATHVFAKK